MAIRVAIVTLLAVSLCSQAQQQSDLQITAQLRYRAEYRQNADFDTQFGDQQAFVAQRLRLRLQWQPQSKLRAVVRVQDSRRWGEAGSTTQPLNSTEFHLGFVEMEELGGLPLAVRIGRQELALGEQRLVGPFDWDNSGRAFDALRLQLGKQRHLLQVWFAHLRDKNAAAINSNQEFVGLHYTTSTDANPILEAYAMMLIDDRDFPIGSSSEKLLWLNTLGLRCAGSVWQNLQFDGEIAYQTGDHGSLSVSAFAVIMRGQYAVPMPWSPTLGLGYEFGSGDSNPNDEKLETFSALFPSIHRHLGAMDYVSRSNSAATDAFVHVTPAAEWSLKLHYFYFQLAHGNDAWYKAEGFNFDRRSETFLPALPGESIELGHEFDLLISYRFRRQVLIAAGLSRFIAGGFIKAGNPGAEDSDWGYLSLTMEL